VPFEADDVDWYELDRPTVSKVLATWNDGPWRPKRDEQGRRYVPHTTMSLSQLWRIHKQGML